MALLHNVWDHVERKGGCSRAEGIKVSCGQAGRSMFLLFQTLLTACGLKMKIGVAFLPSNLHLSHTALGLILRKTVNVCCTCFWEKTYYYD